MERSLDREMIKKIDSVLERVKEPENNCSVGEMGMIRKFRYNRNKRTLYIYANTYSSKRACCYLIAKLIESDVMTQVQKELKNEFPDLSVNFV